jgi:hypothetical protein
MGGGKCAAKGDRLILALLRLQSSLDTAGSLES